MALLLLLGVAPPIRQAAAQDAALAEKSRRGNQLMAAGKFSEAVAIYEELTRAVPGNAGLLLNLGMALHLAGRSRDAIAPLEQALKLQPGIIPAMFMLGGAYLAVNRPEMALPPLRELVAADPNMKDARQMLAQALAISGHHEEALDQFLAWTSMDAADPGAWRGMARTCETLAAKAFQALEWAAPESGYMLARVAWVQASRGDHAAAFSLYREALVREPKLRGVHLALADIYRETGHPDWALVEEAKERTLPAPDCAAHPLECHFRDRKWRVLLAAAHSIKTAESYYWQSRAYQQLADQAVERLVALPPSPESHSLKAEAHRERGRYSDSVREWRAALALRPGDPLLEKELAISLRLNEDYEAARPLAEKLLRQNPGSAELNYLLGQILLNSRQAEEAVPLLEKAVRLEPGFLPARGALGLALLQFEKPIEAIPHLKAALPTDTDGSLHFRLARAYQATKQPDLAKAMLARYREIADLKQEREKAVNPGASITGP